MTLLIHVAAALAAGAIGYAIRATEQRMVEGELRDQLRKETDAYKALSARLRRRPIPWYPEDHTDEPEPVWGDPDPNDETFIPADSPDEPRAGDEPPEGSPVEALSRLVPTSTWLVPAVRPIDRTRRELERPAIVFGVRGGAT